jgi:hypothetical protein
VIWTSSQQSAEPAYPTLRIRIVQSEGTLTGSTRDETCGVEVLVSSGSVDGTGNVHMTVVLSDRGTLLQVLIFSGRVTGSGNEQRIAGTYMGLNPCERGTFSMTQSAYPAIAASRG